MKKNLLVLDDAIDPFVGESRAIRELEARAKKAVASDLPVVIFGEIGTGKGALAKWIHESGPRRRAPFVELHCAGLSRELLEVAHGGTLFLDEISDVDPQLLAERTIDVRLIGATRRDLHSMAHLAVIPLTIPPLRERAEDIPALANQLLAEIARSIGRPKLSISLAASRDLQSYAWPGNVRELRNALERAALLAKDDVLDANDFALHGSNADELRLTLEQMERLHVERVLADVGGRVDRAAERLDVPRSSLYQKIKRYGIRMQALRTNARAARRADRSPSPTESRGTPVA